MVLGEEVFEDTNAAGVGGFDLGAERLVAGAAELFGDLGVDVGLGEEGEDGLFGANGDGVADDGDIAAVGVGGAVDEGATGVVVIDAVGVIKIEDGVAEGAGDGGG